MTAAEAYKKTTDIIGKTPVYSEDHDAIMAEIEDACNEGEYWREFDEAEYRDMAKHAKDLEKAGFSVEREGRMYIVDWEKPKQAKE